MRQQLAGAADVRNKRLKLIDGFVAVKQVQSTEVLPKLRLDADLYEIVLKQHSVIFAHKPEKHNRAFNTAYNKQAKSSNVSIITLKYNENILRRSKQKTEEQKEKPV